MSAKTHHQLAGPVYEEILHQVDYTKVHGSTRQRYNVDTWEPAVQAHGPGGPHVGDACRQCGQPWPCRFLLNLLDSGLVAERSHLS